jgi:hypothetical protein
VGTEAPKESMARGLADPVIFLGAAGGLRSAWELATVLRDR